jgi:branched-subunit amino acid transport protein
LFLIFIGALVSLLGHHSFFGLILPFGFPIWIAIILLFAIWQLASFPLRWMKYQAYAAYMPSVAPYYSGRNVFWHIISSIVWVAFLVLCAWLAYLYIPFVHTVLNNIGAHLSAIR